MDLGDMSLYKLMTRRMDWLQQRHKVISENVANVDTPGYKGHDLKPFTFRDALEDHRRMPARATDAAHLQGTIPKGGLNQEQRVRNPYETAPDGNNVVTEDEMIKMGQTSQDYGMVTNLYRKNVTLLRMAIRSGGGG